MERDHRLLHTVAESAAGGHATLVAALPLATAQTMVQALQEQLEAYSRLLAEVGRQLIAAGLRQPAVNRSRLGSFFVLQVKAMGAEADRRLAELLLQGLHDSVVQLTAAVNASQAPQEAPEQRLARRLLRSEERCYREWKRFL